MKKKLITVLLFLGCVIAGSVGLTACDKRHSHIWSQGWESNDNYHWHNCTQSGCPVTDISEKDGYALHDFTNGDCLCGKKKPTEGLEYNLNSDGESSYVRGIGTATETDIVIASEYYGKPVTSIGNSAFNRCSSLTNITFKGTKAQWNAIEKNYSWDGYTGNYTVRCTDGYITKS